ncbi:hypothetical protein O7623_28455 [Solwaraspora sp. WMMD791]|uniref:hypothetical protein n=1 Tax=Solwaraspora sp. WMMD791 TaxID=3016086 RepID=UPI00249A738D|nr:hypothetical protein [Solwaraspora sp. WMMD791]WFE27135.1 hypothetical protein O7623_28455 [Solwaraspora sp. WMMD791]
MIWSIRAFLMCFLTGLFLILVLELVVASEVIGILVAGCVFGCAISFATAFVPLARFSALIQENSGMQIDGQLPFLRHLVSDLWRMGWRR